MTRRIPWPMIVVLALLLPWPARAATDVRDDSGQLLQLTGPARRIVSLAPHITELLYAAGAGERIVGVVEYSDYPDAARVLPRVGDNERLDLERIAALKPDLLIVWLHGAAQRQLAQLRRLGIPIFHSEPRTLADIAGTLRTFGRLGGSDAVADLAAREYSRRLDALAGMHRDAPPVRVFLQIWNAPPMTVNDRHLISDALRLCGGRNIFGAEPVLAPTVNTEAVIAANPEAIVATGIDINRPNWVDDWTKWPRLTAVARGNLFSIAPELITRHTPRVLDGTALLCRQLDTARARRPR